MTIHFNLLSAMTLVAVWLIFKGLQDLGVPMPRWLVLIAGVIAILAGLLILIGL